MCLIEEYTRIWPDKACFRRGEWVATGPTRLPVGRDEVVAVN